MKKVLLFVGFFLSIHFASAMENSLDSFTVQHRGVDLSTSQAVVVDSDYQAVIDFYWKRKQSFDDLFAQIKSESDFKAKDRLNALVKEAGLLAQESERATNKDTFVGIFESLIDEVVAYRDNLYPDREDPVARSKKIRKYKDKVKNLKDRSYDLLITDLDIPTHIRIKILQDILAQAHAVSFASQRELHEDGFAHDLSCVIRDAARQIEYLQAKMPVEQSQKSRKRAPERDLTPFAPTKRFFDDQIS